MLWRRGACAHRVVSSGLMVTALICGASSPALAQVQELLPPPGMRGKAFGAGLAAQGDTAVVVAGIGIGADASLHVHERIHGAWHWTATVALPSDAMVSKTSRGLAIDGDWVALVGKRIYLFRRDAGAWVHAQTLDLSGQESVALSQSTLVVGSGNQMVRVFEWRAGVWTLWTQFQSTQAQEEFGSAVALDDDWLVVGSPKVYSVFPDNIGHAYLYRRTVDASGTVDWELTQTLTGGLGDGFGRSAAIDGDTLVVGAPGQFDTGSPDMDRVHVYRLGPTGTWSHTQTLVGDENAIGLNPKTRFGSAVAVSDFDLIVGSNWHSPSAALSGTGAAYHYRFNGSYWQQIAKWLPGASGQNDLSGSTVALAGSYGLVGVPFRDTACRALQPNCDAGAVWVHELLP